ncbi:MAG: PA14 domain-containing protein [Planctomycetota bacterium]
MPKSTTHTRLRVLSFLTAISCVLATLPVAAADRAPGLAMNVYRVGRALGRIPEVVAGEEPNISRAIAQLDLDKANDDFGEQTNHFVAHIDGFLAVKTSGKYRFRLTSDDGSRLLIGDQVVVDADGLRAGDPREGEVFLKSGLHPLRVLYFENNGASYLRVEWRPPRQREFDFIPQNRLFHDPAKIVPVSPGNKRMVSQKMPFNEKLRHDERVLHAIDAGIAYLLKMTEREQVAADNAKNDVGQVAFETYALLAAGVSVDHPLIVANLDYIEERVYRPGNTYALSSYLFALDAAIAQAEYDFAITNPDAAERVIAEGRLGKKYTRRMKKATKALIAGQNKEGGWRYVPTTTDADASCTQFSALALGVAARRRVDVPARTWKLLADYFLNGQEATGPIVRLELTPMLQSGSYKDRLEREDQDQDGSTIAKGDEKPKGKKKRRGGTGVRDEIEPLLPAEAIEVQARGFKYQPVADRDVTWSMTCAGVSTLLLVHDQAGHLLKPAQRAAIRKSLHDSLGWLQQNWSPTNHYYYGMYSLEKVGDLGRLLAIGGNDWYRQLSMHLLSEQERDGSWPRTGNHGESVRVTTSFALLVLGRATSLLTRKNPTEQIIVTGGETETREGPRSSEWVYVPDLDTRVYLPGILRALRLRPNAKLVQLLDKVCRCYPEKERPELIPGLLRARGRSTPRSVQKVILGCLNFVCGEKLKADEDFQQRFDDWERVRQIGQLRQQENGAELLALHDKYPKNATLLRAILEAIGQLRVVDAVPRLLDDLEDSNKVIRSAANFALRAIHTDGVPPFDPAAAANTRAAQVAVIREWVETRS